MRHLRPILALALAQVSVFSWLLFLTKDGAPFRVIPYDFRSLGAPWLIYGWDAIRAGFLPLWCPYVGGGVPYFLNPQTSLYTPLSLLFGPLFGFSYYTAQLFTVATMLVGGIGAYALAIALWRRRSAALLSGLCFELGSALFSHLQHQTIVAAYALTPWILWAILMAVDRRSVWGPLILAWFVYWLLAGGYLGIIMMLVPWTLAFAVSLTFRQPMSLKQRARRLGGVALFALLGAGMAALNWMPFVLNASEFSRGTPLAIDYVLDGARSLTPKDVLGVLWSFLTVHPLPGTTLDLSMRGIYIGAAAAALAVVCLTWARGWIIKALLVLAAGSLLMAFGGAFFGRVLLHILVPAFNFSRFPAADSRELLVLALSLLAGGGAILVSQRIAPAFQMGRTAFRGLVVFYLLSFFGVLWIYGKPIDAALSTLSFEILCMLLALLVLVRLQGTRMILALAAIIVLETGYCAMMNFTPAGQPMSAPAYAQLSQHVTTFTSAGAELPRLGNGANPVDESSSEGYVAKKFHINEYNPLRLNRFVSLIDKGFLPWMQTGPRVVALPPGSAPSNHAEFAPQATPVKFMFIQYTPNYVRYKVSPTKDSLLVFNEIYFPGWKATVDGQPEPIQPLLNGLRALTVKGGDHDIEFTFRAPTFFVALGISLASFALFVFLALRLRSQLKAGKIHQTGEPPALFLGARSTET